MVGIASRCPFEGIVMVAYATFFCICAALDLSAALEMTEDLENHYPLVCHFDWRKSLIFGVEKSFLFSLSYSFVILRILLSISTKRVERSAWRNLFFIIFFGYICNIYLYFIAPIIGGPL